MKIITIHKSAIERLCSQWPCHGIPDKADLIVAAFDQEGDLVDYDISDTDDNVIQENTWDGSGALSALLEDAQANATETNIPNTVGPMFDYY